MKEKKQQIKIKFQMFSIKKNKVKKSSLIFFEEAKDKKQSKEESEIDYLEWNVNQKETSSILLVCKSKHK